MPTNATISCRGNFSHFPTIERLMFEMPVLQSFVWYQPFNSFYPIPSSYFLIDCLLTCTLYYLSFRGFSSFNSISSRKLWNLFPEQRKHQGQTSHAVTFETIISNRGDNLTLQNQIWSYSPIKKNHTIKSFRTQRTYLTLNFGFASR